MTDSVLGTSGGGDDARLVGNVDGDEGLAVVHDLHGAWMVDFVSIDDP